MTEGKRKNKIKHGYVVMYSVQSFKLYQCWSAFLYRLFVPRLSSRSYWLGSMGSKIECVCCGKRLGGNGKRPVIINSLRIFISARLFPSRLPDDGFICNTCR